MTETKQRRGFAAMSPEKRRELSARGGRAVQAAGKGRQWTSETAASAGRKGGLAAGARRAKGGR